MFHFVPSLRVETQTLFSIFVTTKSDLSESRLFLMPSLWCLLLSCHNCCMCTWFVRVRPQTHLLWGGDLPFVKDQEGLVWRDDQVAEVLSFFIGYEGVNVRLTLLLPSFVQRTSLKCWLFHSQAIATKRHDE